MNRSDPISRFRLLCWPAAMLLLSGCQATLPSRDHVASTTTAINDTTPDGSLTTEWPQAPALSGTLAGLDLSGPEGESSLWQRIRRGFQLSTPENQRVSRHLKWYAKHPQHLHRVGERARPYLHHIVDELEKRNMPLELALLPAVESGFRPTAYSSYRAAGIWQFIPSTGKMFGLEQNWWYDGRRDIVAATDAALDYLESLAEQFDGDWELALAAYNSGAGTVRRAIRKNRERGKPTDYWSLKLPRETQSYVPRLLALSRVVSDPDQAGNRLPVIPNRPHFSTVDVGSQIDLALAAEMAGISESELRDLNPGFNRWASPPEGPHHLALPIDRIPVFERELARLDVKSRLPWSRYAIRSGDTLGAIARRHGTTVAAIKRANNLSSNRISAGGHLLIPGDIAKAPPRTSVLADASATGGSYTVKPGDSLWSIARQHNLSHHRLAAWNSMAVTETLQPGQQLVLSGVATRATLTSLNYKVRKGDSLASIARRFNVKVADLHRWNHLPGQYLQPGQSIQLQLNLADQSI
ncbi:MAG: LysM peptidoglycan-binding domain-containing protein [Gammaproteobacteria bacterium]|nr:LysM peptidoglycan-binding domain-containing protein [Gammaproteobacteria bacterium]